MLNASLLKQLKDDLIKKAKEKNNNFVSLCLDVGDIRMCHIVRACDFYVNEDSISIEVDNFILSITPRSCFEIEKHKNDIESEYVLKNENSNLYVVI